MKRQYVLSVRYFILRNDVHIWAIRTQTLDPLSVIYQYNLNGNTHISNKTNAFTTARTMRIHKSGLRLLVAAVHPLNLAHTLHFVVFAVILCYILTSMV